MKSYGVDFELKGLEPRENFYVGWQEISEAVHMDSGTLYLYQKKGFFPLPVGRVRAKPGKGNNWNYVWFKSDIDTWLTKGPRPPDRRGHNRRAI